MARLNFPNFFAGIVKLFTSVKAKYVAEAGASKLQPYLDEQGIVMADDETDVNNAVTANTAFDKAAKEAEKQTAERDKLFAPVFQSHEGQVQFMKKLFRNNVQKLGDWGVTVDARGRVVYPPDFARQQSAVLLFIAKHNSFPVGTSPLQPYLDENEIDIAANKTDADDALSAHNEFMVQDTLREQKREARDVLIEPVVQHLRGEGQYLMGMFPKTPKKAGQWGFVVDDSPQADRIRDVILKPGEVKTIHDALLKSVLTYNGPEAATIFSGKTVEGTGITLNSGGTFIIKRTFGTFTIKNESNTRKVSFTFTENR